MKLEKIVDPDLHRDTDQERAQKLVDAMQDAKIKTNGEEISKLKNGEKLCQQNSNPARNNILRIKTEDQQTGGDGNITTANKPQPRIS